MRSFLPGGAADHPRIRGEHDGRDGVLGDDPGSSPHTRGALKQEMPSEFAKRIIPAYAGSTDVVPVVA